PKLNSRNNTPKVEGAYTPSNRVGIPPARSTSRSSMLSAPAPIPAITLISLGTGFAAPERIRGAVIDTFAAMICGSRVCWASPSIGTNPAHDTRLSSSKRAESVVNLCDTRTGSAFLEPDHSVPRNTYRSSSEGTFLIHTPLNQHRSSTDPGLAGGAVSPATATMPEAVTVVSTEARIPRQGPVGLLHSGVVGRNVR